MDARELRIGNYIQYFGNVAQVEGIVNESNGFGLQLNGGDFASINSQSLEPIPLTEEWLVKFGFKYKGNGLYTYGFKNMFKVNCHEFGIDFYYGNTYPYYVKPNFVHGLQNLYFALTREELTIKTK